MRLSVLPAATLTALAFVVVLPIFAPERVTVPAVTLTVPLNVLLSPLRVRSPEAETIPVVAPLRDQLLVVPDARFSVPLITAEPVPVVVFVVNCCLC